MATSRLVLAFCAAFLLYGCGSQEDQGAQTQATDVGAEEVFLSAQIPDEEAGRTLRWSPYGQQLPLTEADGGMNARLPLGPYGTGPVDLRLVKSAGSQHFDGLFIDLNRDGEFVDTELVRTEVSETNGKLWSSFDAVVGIPVTDPETSSPAINPYALSLWYVEDPRVPDEDPVIRFSRRGWMEGELVLDGLEAVLMLTESAMDGVFSSADSWALASRDSAQDILKPWFARSVEEHAWLFGDAYRITEIDPSGRRVVVTPFDPGMTRIEEEEMNDHLAVDRNADRSGRVVAFLHDFEEAEVLARQEGKALFIDFETTWCGPCKVMDEWVYTADAVVDVSRAVVSVKVDGDERLDLKERFGVTGFPTMILLGADGTEKGRASGYVNVADMTEFLTSSG
ncbi:MAG: thioredoxin family protein [Gemmatimonadetes bacterium]|nr:thioredoxin family protein [Gemmatimonadota bacterium]NNM05396.1 thioredoxin family protein [Gemmatimonadota bacterium]